MCMSNHVHQANQENPVQTISCIRGNQIYVKLRSPIYVKLRIFYLINRCTFAPMNNCPNYDFKMISMNTMIRDMRYAM